MKSSPFVLLFLFFTFGIIAAANFPIGLFYPYFFLILFILLAGISLYLKNFISVQISSLLSCFLLFFLGFVVYSIKVPLNQKNNITNHYLKQDVLIGHILSSSKTQGNFKKIEFEVKKIIRFQDTISVSGKIVLFLKDSANLLNAYDVCAVNCDLLEIKNKKNPGEFDSENFWKHKEFNFLAFADENSYHKIGKISPPWTDKFVQLRNYFSSVLENHLTGDELGVAKALILGDRSSLDAEITNKFGNTGAMHVLAVSGLHVGILVQILTWLLGGLKKWISKNQTVLIALLLIWIYAFLTGLSASVLRSVIMFSILALGTLLEKRNSNYNGLAFSAILILCWNPHFLYDIGFQLSYLAMLGIFMFYPPLSKVIYVKNKILKNVVDGTMVGIAAQIMTVPLTLYYFHQFPNYFIITNIGLMVFSFLVLALGLALFAGSGIIYFSKFLAILLSFSLTVMLLIISFIDQLPGAVAFGFELNLFTVIALFILILLFFFYFERQKIIEIQLTLILSMTILVAMVYVRNKNIQNNQICFFQSEEVNFAIKQNQKILVFYANRDKSPKKVSFLAKNFQKLYQGEMEFIEIFSKKSTFLKNKHSQITVERQKGGYAIQINDKDFFYVTNLNNQSNSKNKIYASWIEETQENHLKEKAIQFALN